MSTETVATLSPRVDPTDRHSVHGSVHDLLEARARANATGLCPRCEAVASYEHAAP
jgi:hypothetical protein